MTEEIPARPPDGHRVVCGECGKHHFGTNPPILKETPTDVVLSCRECSTTLFALVPAEVES